MSEEENQNEEENNEENNEENKEENKEEEKKEEENFEKNINEIIPEENNNEINVENEEQQEQQAQENLEVENENNEEAKEDANENNNEQNDNNILKETEENDIKNEINALNNNINNNIKPEINIIDNVNKENEIGNEIIQENGQQIENEEDNKEVTMLSVKKINAEQLLSFGKNEYLIENTLNTNGFGYNEKKNTRQLLNEIKNDMDLLEKDLNPLFNKYQKEKNFYNDNGDYDEQDQEIKKLIEKANKLINNHDYN